MKQLPLLPCCVPTSSAAPMKYLEHSGIDIPKHTHFDILFWAGLPSFLFGVKSSKIWIIWVLGIYIYICILYIYIRIYIILYYYDVMDAFTTH